MRLVPDGQVLSLLWLKGVLGEEHRVVVGLPDVGLPVALRVVEGVDEVLVGLEVVEHFGVLGDQVVHLFSLRLETVQLGHQVLLYL